ncbi:MAG TPA: hypothetical protein VF751_11500, partial [Chthoniobacterales bacterium]
KAEWQTDSDRKLVRALAWGASVAFLLVNLLPGGLPRYSMPALVPACWLMAMTLASPEVHWRGKTLDQRVRRRVVVWAAVVTGILLCLYAGTVAPVLQRRAKVKPIAAQIDRLVPKGETLYAVDPDYQPFLFYVRSRLVYASSLEEVPPSAHYLLVQAERESALRQIDRWRPIERITDYRNHTVIIARAGGNSF